MRLQLQHENGNNADYAHLLFSNLENYSSRSPSAPQYFVNRRISKAFHFFCNRLNTESAEGLDKTLRLYNTVMQASIVQILVKDSTAALTLFESLNNRGVALSVVDVIKSHLFTSNSLKNQNNTEIVEDNLNRRWADILKLLGDDYQVHERFFRHNYNAFRTDWTLHIGKSVDENGNYPLGNLATKYSLDRIYRDIFTSCHSIMETIDLITEHAKLYQNILASDPESKTPFHIYYLSLARVQGSTSYLLLLYLEKNRKLLELKDETIIRIIKLITAFFVRRNLTDVPATRDLNKIFINIIESIMELNLVGSAVFDKIKLQLTNTLPPEEEFAEALRGDLYADNQNLTSFILRSLADSKKTKEEASAWDFKSNHSTKSDRRSYILTIEHILPQTKGKHDLNEQWITMLMSNHTSKEQVKEIQMQYMHKLGNLTLTGYNSELSANPFLEKRDKKDNNGKFVGFKNGLSLNQDVADKNQWTSKEIDERTERLLREIIELFTLDV